jgi:paraquat-inducible protein A
MSTGAVTAADSDLASCHTCCKLSPASLHRCPRCGATLHLRITDSVQRTEYLGVPEASTIMGGVVVLVKLGSIPVAAVIFIASVVVPLAKIAAMFYLTWSVARRKLEGPRRRTKLYVVAEFVGKWLQGLLAFYPGIAAYSFAGVVLVTMVAAENFDSRLMWDQLEEKNDSSRT